MKNIVKLRKEKQISRKELAKYMHMSEAAIGRRERGEVPLTEYEIQKLIDIFGCTYEKLLDGELNNAK